MLLELMGESLEWRSDEKLSMVSALTLQDQVKVLKQNAMLDPENKLWKSNSGSKELQTIFKHIKSLEFEQKPDYALIKEQLTQIMKDQLQP